MEDLLEVTLNELLRYRRSPVSSTADFQELKHNDYLCPRFAAQLCEYIEGSRRYQNVAYDVQGLRDRGKDVVLRFGEAEEEFEFVTFQIKSFGDLEDDNYLRTLKAQSFEVREDYGAKLKHHFIVVCTDLAEHQNKVRSICAEFSKAEWATVVEPQYALTFLRLSTSRIDAIVQSVLREEDAVYKAALGLIADLIPVDVAVLLTLLWEARDSGSYIVDLEALRSSSFIDDVLDEIPDAPRDDFFFDHDYGDPAPDYAERDRRRSWDERVSESLEVLDGGAIDLDSSSNSIHVNPSQNVALEALMIDAVARFGFTGDELIRFVFDTLDVVRTCEVDTLEV